MTQLSFAAVPALPWKTDLTGGGMDMIVEVKVKDESAFVKEVCALDTVQSASLIAHDGEVTF